MDIKKFERQESRYYRVTDGKIIAVESEFLGDDDDLYESKKDYRFSLNQYEGPLDLLLFLVKRAKIRIEDIFISDITSQYLAIIKEFTEWDEYDAEYAGDFIAMAADLVEYKSKRMLPTEQSELPDVELPGDALIRKAQMYDMFKKMSERLREKETVNSFYREPVFSDDDYIISIKDFNFDKMLDSYAKLIHRVSREEGNKTPKTIPKEKFTVAECVNKLSRRIFESKSLKMFSLFESDYTKVEIINTFLAVLELLKRQVITVTQEQPFADLDITLREGVESPFSVDEEDKELAEYSTNS